jgi:hypothetical protein
MNNEQYRQLVDTYDDLVAKLKIRDWQNYDEALAKLKRKHELNHRWDGHTIPATVIQVEPGEKYPRSKRDGQGKVIQAVNDATTSEDNR